MIEKKYRRITDIPRNELQESLSSYARKHLGSVRSARRYLRGLGMKIDNKGLLIY